MMEDLTWLKNYYIAKNVVNGNTFATVWPFHMNVNTETNTMNNFQREAILRCKRCKHEWKIMDNIRSNNLKMYPCPECEGFKSGWAPHHM